jgi:hypothetical protein
VLVLPNAVVRYKMAFLNCKHLRRTVMSAGAILIIGMFLEVFVHLMPSASNLPILQFVALAIVMASPVIILMMMVFSFFPVRSFKDCSQ